jgi:hypothetical protein
VNAQVLEPWQALSRRIQGLVKAAQLCKPNESYSIVNRLGVQALKILGDLERFRASFSHSLPPSAMTAISDCVRLDVDISAGKLLHNPDTTGDLRKEQIWSALVLLAAFETEMTFTLSDAQVAIRTRSERAFSHLKRLIVVDSIIRERWIEALKSGEVACEKLGAVHLLWHGIWAFKVSAEGERTDLVYQETAVGIAEGQRFADGLVLTEWKVAKTDNEAQKRFDEARIQAKRYAEGVLAGNELRAFRYLVVVSNNHITVPEDFEDEAVVYRHINIVTSPATPSQHSKRRSRPP